MKERRSGLEAEVRLVTFEMEADERATTALAGSRRRDIVEYRLDY